MAKKKAKKKIVKKIKKPPAPVRVHFGPKKPAEQKPAEPKVTPSTSGFEGPGI